MLKTQVESPDARPRAKRSYAPRVFLAVVLLGLAPLGYEAGLIVVSNWQAMNGMYSPPRTPFLAAIADWSRTAGTEFRFQTDRLVGGGHLDPAWAVPIGVGWAALTAYLFLRKVH